MSSYYRCITWMKWGRLLNHLVFIQWCFKFWCYLPFSSKKVCTTSGMWKLYSTLRLLKRSDFFQFVRTPSFWICLSVTFFFYYFGFTCFHLLRGYQFPWIAENLHFRKLFFPWFSKVYINPYWKYVLRLTFNFVF